MEFPNQSPREPLDLPTAGDADDSSFPPWVMLHRYSYERGESSVADAETTLASCFTSTGRLFSVFFGVDAPPGVSTFYYNWAGRPPGADQYVQNPRVVAAHGDCLLLEMFPPRKRDRDRYRGPETTVVIDYFLYEAAVDGRPPSLSLLPACHLSKQFERSDGEAVRRQARVRLSMDGDTGLLRRGGAEFLVAQLELRPRNREGPRDVAELCMLRPGLDSDWQLKTVPIVYDNGSRDDHGIELLRWWQADESFAVGNQFLCWVDYYRGFLICDMAVDGARLRLRYVPLPVEPPQGNPDKIYEFGRRGRMEKLAPAGTREVRYISIESRCCCGGSGSTTCSDGRFLFTVTTWTMSLGTDEPMTWVKDGVLDCEELWSQPGYRNLPRHTMEHPVVSVDNPDIVCFVVRNDFCYYLNRQERKAWMLEVDTKSKALRSVAPYDTNEKGQEGHCFPVKLRR